MKPSGIGGQAVIEGIMMRNKDKYSIAVRKPDNEIEVTVRESKVLTEKHKWMSYPVIRGVVSFIDSLITGISTINYSASFYDDPDEQKKTKADEIGKSIFKDKFESVLMALTVIVSVFLAVGLFMLLPYYVSRLVKGYVASKTLLNLIEGLVRVAIFILYLVLISLMKDIKRTFMYHGAEHKCINCIENGARLTVENVMNSSRYHKRCGTSFLFIVMFISVVFFIFIRVDNTALQIVIRLLLVPVIAGVAYEFIRWAGRNDNGFTVALSRPGMWLQKLTTREPDEDMVEVAIKAVEEVFDWEVFLKEYYQTSLDMEADIKAAEAKLALTGELIHKPKKTRKIDAREVAMAETLKSVESKSLAGSDKAKPADTNKTADKPDNKTGETDKHNWDNSNNNKAVNENAESADKDSYNSDTDTVKTDTTDTGNVEAEPDTVNAVDDTDNGNSDEDNAKSDSEALQENAESDDKAQESTEADNETSQENADDDLPEGFEIEDHYETVEKIKTETGSKYAFTTENVQEDIDESENMSVEEVEAAFEIEETEQEEENISADEVPLFKQRDRE
jgi:uncharacterized protein YqhQ